MYRVLFLLLPCLLTGFCTSTDTISLNQSIRDSHGDILVSSGEFFALGFFSPPNSNKRYIGIWYNKVSEQTIVWVANRDNPINDSSGVLSIDNTTGNLVIHGGDNSTIPLWSTNVVVAGPANTCSAQLLNSGNLILIQGVDKKVVAWQGFDYPTDTKLPEMKLGVDRRTGLNRFLTAWKSRDDPGTGEYSYKMNLSGSPQFFLSKGSVPLWRTGPWNGLRWSGIPEMGQNFIINATYIDNHDEVTLFFGLVNASLFSRMVVNESGIMERLTWHEGNRRWDRFWSAPEDRCDSYDICGSYGNCNPPDDRELRCRCLPGFEPKVASDWYLRDASAGCVRKRGGHTCGNGEGFVRMTHANIPYASVARVNMSLSLKACEEACLKNCSCSGYASADIRGGGSGCVTWHGELVDTRVFSNAGQDLYIRVDAVELGT